MWQEVLGVDTVGANDNFFDLGGHSLLMVRVHGRLFEIFKGDLSVVDLLRYPRSPLSPRSSQPKPMSRRLPGPSTTMPAGRGLGQAASRLFRPVTPMDPVTPVDIVGGLVVLPEVPSTEKIYSRRRLPHSASSSGTPRPRGPADPQGTAALDTASGGGFARPGGRRNCRAGVRPAPSG